MYIRSTYIHSPLTSPSSPFELGEDSWPEMYTAPWPSIHLCTWVSSAPTHLLFSAPENQQNKKQKISTKTSIFLFFFSNIPAFVQSSGTLRERERAPVSQSKKFCWLTDIIIHHSSTGPAADEKGERMKQQLHSTPDIRNSRGCTQTSSSLAYSSFFYFLSLILSFHLHFSRSICQQESLSLSFNSFSFFSFFLSRVDFE